MQHFLWENNKVQLFKKTNFEIEMYQFYHASTERIRHISKLLCGLTGDNNHYVRDFYHFVLFYRAALPLVSTVG